MIPNQLAKIIMDLRWVLDSYMKVTTKEIKIIKRILECSNKIDNENYKNLKLIETDLKIRIQKVINQVKVMDINITGTTHDILDKWNNTRSKQCKQKGISKNNDSDKSFKDSNIAYEKLKEGIKSTITKDKYTPYTLQLEIRKDILIDKYIPNSAGIVARNDYEIFKYQVYISNENYTKNFIVNTEKNGNK